MRVSKQAAAENRKRILTEAARLIRENGIDGAGVAAITEAAGLTHGAFYSQFESKEAVVAEALRVALGQSSELWARQTSGERSGAPLERIIDLYLSPRHRDSPGAGCAIAALGSDITRQPKAVREVFTTRLKDGLEMLAGLIPATTAARRRDAAIQHFSAMVGALILARAIEDEDLSKRILQTVANGLKDTTPESRASEENDHD